MAPKGRDFLSLQDFSPHELHTILRKAILLKKRPYGMQLRRKTIVMLFAKPSTRTRVSFEVAINQLGGDDIFLSLQEAQMSRGESMEDTARVLSRYCDGIVARLFSHKDLEALAAASSVPVINGLTDLLHPCQALADMMTILEKKKTLEGLKLVFVGDGNNNVTHSLMHACSKLGMNMVVSCPRGYEPQRTIINNFRKNSRASHALFEIIHDPKHAAKQANVLYTDTWISMGEEKEARKRAQLFRKYQLNSKLLSLAKKDCMVMHDLPAHRGMEITSDVMDGRQSVVWDQAENRLHVEKAILTMIFGK